MQTNRLNLIAIFSLGKHTFAKKDISSTAPAKLPLQFPVVLEAAPAAQTRQTSTRNNHGSSQSTPGPRKHLFRAPRLSCIEPSQATLNQPLCVIRIPCPHAWQLGRQDLRSPPALIRPISVISPIYWYHMVWSTASRTGSIICLLRL